MLNHQPVVTVLCTTCNWTTKYYTSRKVKSDSKANAYYEMKVRAVMTITEIERNHTAF